MNRKLTKAEAEVFKYVRTFGDLPNAEENTFIEVTMAGSRQKKMVRADRIVEITYMPSGDGMVFIVDNTAAREKNSSGFPVLEDYETVIELCIRARLQIIRKD